MGLSRRILREHMFKLLFLMDFQQDEQGISERAEEQIRLYFEQVPDEEMEHPPIFADSEDQEYIRNKVMDVLTKLPEIDERINQEARGWRTGRMAKADLAVLRLGVYEIMFDEDIPDGVAINEAVELAKSFCSDASPAFVNGVLARFAKKS